MKAAAVFDLDGTLIRGTSAERLLVPWLVRRGVVGLRQLAAAAGLAAGLPVLGRTRALRRNKRWLAGVAADRVLPVLDEFLDEAVEGRWCRTTLVRLEELRAEGHEIFILSGAPTFLVEAVGKRLGVEGKGTDLERIDGRFTGRLGGPHWFAEAKPQALRELAEARDLDLAASWGFADHPSDVPFLACFGHPVVVDPTPALREVARDRGWEILGCADGVPGGPGGPPPRPERRTA